MKYQFHIENNQIVKTHIPFYDQQNSLKVRNHKTWLIVPKVLNQLRVQSPYSLDQISKHDRQSPKGI